MTAPGSDERTSRPVPTDSRMRAAGGPFPSTISITRLEVLTLDGAKSGTVVNSTNNMLESYYRTMKMLLGNRLNL